MKRDVIAPPLESSFLSCERDTETILKKLFIESRQHSKTLKRLLIISNKDCIANTSNTDYVKADQMSLKQLIDEGYVILSPIDRQEEHAPLKAAIVLSFSNFLPNQTNPEFRDCTVNIDVVCNLDCWELLDYQQRPFKILGYIDGILNNARLSGIGKLQFIGCNGPEFAGDIGMYSMMYRAVHGSDDRLSDEEYNGI